MTYYKHYCIVRWLNSHQIDPIEWNRVVNTNPAFRHYYQFEYLNLCGKDWGALVWPEYEIVWPLCIKKFPLAQVYQPLTAQQLGPLFSTQYNGDEINRAIDWMLKRFWRIDVKFNSDYTSQIQITGQQRQNIELDLNAAYIDLSGKYNRNALSNLKKSKACGIDIRCTNEFYEDAIEAFRIGKGKALSGLSDAFYKEIRSVFTDYLTNGKAETWVAFLDDKAIAYVMLVKTTNRLLNLFTATKPEARSTGSMHALFDSIIKEYSGKNIVLDFEGSEDENLAFFYGSFGGVSRIYLHYHSGWRIPYLS